MVITFDKAKLKKIFNESKRLDREFGNRNAKKIQIRMSVLRAALSLEQVPKVKPDRCHELTNNRKGTFAVDLEHPFRLVFRPNMDTVPLKDDGGIDLAQVTTVKILGVEDYH
ncbi:MAG: killer suppression protein [Spirochaetota bacterium]|nr:killer suppression protein [Spirochaetota bacterium]